VHNVMPRKHARQKLHKQPHLALIATAVRNDFCRPETRTHNQPRRPTCASHPKSRLGERNNAPRTNAQHNRPHLQAIFLSCTIDLTMLEARQQSFLITGWFVVLKSKPPHQPTGTFDIVCFQCLNLGKVRSSVSKVRFAVHEGECCCVRRVRHAVQQGEV